MPFSKKRSVRILSLFLLFLLSLTGCNSTPPSDTSSGETDPPIAETTGDTDPRTVLDVTWNFGYVGSDTNSEGYAYMIHTEGTNYSYTDVITLEKAGTKLTFTDPSYGKTAADVFCISTWKNVAGTWMIYAKATNIKGNDELVMQYAQDGIVYTYISSEDNEQIRICYRSGQQSAEDAVTHPTVYVEETNEPGTATGILTEDDILNQWLENDKSRAYYDILEGKTFTVIGDSYLAGSGISEKLVWASLLAKKYNMVYHNYAIGGSTVSNYVTNHNPMVDRYGVMIQNNPDIVFVEGGRNDYNCNVPIGTLSDTSTKTMMGATRYLLTKIREKYPNAVIIAMTCWDTGNRQNELGFICSDYADAMLEVCTDMGIPCIDASDQNAMGVYMTDPLFRAEYCIAENDVSHLNEKGMKKVLPVFEQYIVSILSRRNGVAP